MDRLLDKRSITAKWIYHIKQGLDETISKLKVRVVARGFQQQEGIDYDDVFAPVINWSTITAILVLAAKKKWFICHMDVITTFLNSLLQEKVFMEVPDCFPRS